MIFIGVCFAAIYSKEALDILDFLVSPFSTFPLSQIEMLSSTENNLVLHHM